MINDKFHKVNDDCSLIILGQLFRDKGHETSTRATRELTLTLKEKLKAPVIYGLIFTFQKPILNVLGGPLHNSYR